MRRLSGTFGAGAAAWAAAPLAAVALAACGGGAREPAATDRPPAREARVESTAERRPPRPTRVARPVEIEIPAIGVRAPVIALGLNRDRTLEVPKDYDDTGWWTGGPEPGERGPAVIAGHVDSKTGPAAFYRLGELDDGDIVVIRRRDGSRVRFAVTRTERHPKDGFPTEAVYGPTPRPELRLITCSGDFDTAAGHYEDNTIVFATRA